MDVVAGAAQRPESVGSIQILVFKIQRREDGVYPGPVQPGLITGSGDSFQAATAAGKHIIFRSTACAVPITTLWQML